jgi:hypothetical protein
MTPSTATTAERFPPLTDEQREAAARHREHREATTDAVLAQVLHLRTVTAEAIYDLAEPIRPTIEGYSGYRLEAQRLRVSRHSGAPAHVQGDHIKVTARVRPVNLNGRPRANGVPTWIDLPERLAAPLIDHRHRRPRVLPREFSIAQIALIDDGKDDDPQRASP